MATTGTACNQSTHKKGCEQNPYPLLHLILLKEGHHHHHRYWNQMYLIESFAFLHLHCLQFHAITCCNECDQNHHFAAHSSSSSSSSSLDPWSYLLQWMWSKSSFCSTFFFFFIFGSTKLLVTMNVIKIIILQHILLLHLWIYEVTCCNESGWKCVHLWYYEISCCNKPNFENALILYLIFLLLLLVSFHERDFLQ